MVLQNYYPNKFKLSVQHQSLEKELPVTDEKNNIVDVNPAFTNLTGYTLDEIGGMNPRLLKSGNHDLSFYNEMWESIQEKGQWQGELWDRRKDGSLYYKYLSISVIRGNDGKVFRYVAQFFDITERKQKDDLIWKQANYDSLYSGPRFSDNELRW